MLLRNYDNIMQTFALDADDQTNTSDFKDGILNIKLPSGSLSYIIKQYGSNTTKIPLSRISETVQNSGFWIGSGSTEPTYDDYTLESPYTSTDYSAVSGSKNVTTVFNAENNCWEETTKITYVALTDLNISEIGIGSAVHPRNSNTASLVYPLVYRKVLETPIEATANATFILEFKKVTSAYPNKPADYVASASVE